MQLERHITCIVVDDEPLAVKLLAGYINQTPALHLLLKTTHAHEALHAMAQTPPDLLFLDIQMPVQTGFDITKAATAQSRIIYTTAYPQYAAESYEYNAVDYLLKPFSYERFLTAVDRARERVLQPVTSLFIKTEHRLQKILLPDILYIEGGRDYITLHTTTGKILTLESMKNMEEQLPGDQFLRIHRSYIINLQKMHAYEKGQVLLGGVRLPVGDTYKPSFLEKLYR